MNNIKTLIKRFGNRVKMPFNKHSKTVMTVAIFLAFVMAFSALGSNLSSIVRLLDIQAADGDVYYDADLTLYDYYDDNDPGNSEIGSFSNFNTALYNWNNYVTGATNGRGTYSTLGDLRSSPDHPGTYFPLYLGLQYADSSAPDPKVNNVYVKSNPNSYNYSLAANSAATGDNGVAAAAQGLVDSELHDGTVTQGNGRVKVPYFDPAFVQGRVGSVESGLTFKFRRRVDSGSDTGEVYYVYDSSKDGIKMLDDKKTYEAVDPSEGSQYNDEKGKPGFFPLGEKNYGFGAKFEIRFTMTEDGTLFGRKDKPAIFRFEGDDDLWVFVDGKLVLDIGGAHGAVTGEVNFHTGTSHVSAVKTADAFAYNRAQGDVADCIASDVTEDITGVLNSIGMYNDPTEVHTMTVFYMERGRIESNCKISFNFARADALIIQNKVNADKVNPEFKNDAIAAAESEGVEYLMLNKGASVAESEIVPDTESEGDILYNVPLERIKKGQTGNQCNVRLYIPDDGGGWKVYRETQYDLGTRVLVPNDVTLDGYVFRGWATSEGDAESGTVTYPPNSNDFIRLTGDVNLYGVFEVHIEPPTAPMLPIVISVMSSSGNVYSVEHMDFEQVTVSNRTQLFANMTYSFNFDDENKERNEWFKYNNVQPGTNSGYTDHTGGDLGQDTIHFKAGWLYVVNVGTKNVYKYKLNGTGKLEDPFGSSPSTTIVNTDLQNWFTAYCNLYNALKVTRDGVTERGNWKEAGQEQAYTDALAVYEKAKYSSTEGATTYTATVNKLNEMTNKLAAYEQSLSTVDFDVPQDDLSSEEEPGIVEPQENPEEGAPEEGTDTVESEADSQDGSAPQDDTSEAQPEQPAEQETQPTESQEGGEAQSEEKTDLPLPVSGGTNSNTGGRWVNSTPDQYSPVTGTNYRLKWMDAKNSVVRQTRESDDGKFNLLGNQQAKFTMQFSRSSALKLAQTGSSYGFEDLRNDTDNTSPAQSKLSGEGGMEKLLSARYKTTWKISDDRKPPEGESDVVISNDSEKATEGWTKANSVYSAHQYENAIEFPSSSQYGATDIGSFLMDYVGDASANRTDLTVTVTVEYENEIRTSDLYVTKTVGTDGQSYLDKFNSAKKYDNQYRFDFKVSFSHVFGGDSTEKPYTGKYMVKRGDYYVDQSGSNHGSAFEYRDGKFYYVDADGKVSTSPNAGYTSFDNFCKTAADGVISIKEGETFVIEGIPVDTSYSVTEILPDAEEKKGEWALEGVKVALKDGESDVAVECEQSVEEVGDYKRTNYRLEGKITANNTPEANTADPATENKNIGTSANGYSGYIAAYDGDYLVDVKHNSYTFNNNVPSAVLVITKTVNELYYCKENPTDITESFIVGGVTNDNDTRLDSTKDPHGYERATEAEQTFVYRISEYEKTDTGYEHPTRVFYEEISFPIGSTAISTGVGGYRRSKLIRVDESKNYVVEELSDWSWKYTLNNSSVDSGATFTIDSTKAKITITGFNTTGSATIDNVITADGEKSGIMVSNYAHLKYTNNKQGSPKSTVEGDVTVAENTVNVTNNKAS